MHKAKILIVENSSIALQIMKRYLRNEAVVTSAAATGEEALSAARKNPPDLIYLAFTLPGMDGAACCRSLKSDPELARVPIVMIANATDEETGLCRASGCDALITRPVDRREFLQVGRSLLAGIRNREQREPCRAMVSCTLNNNAFYGTIEDISTSGMFVGTVRAVKPGDILAMKFVLPWSGAALIETGACIAWLNIGKHRRNHRLPAGFGALFQELSGNAEDQIKDYLEFISMRLSS
jgi:CheY-like chemotaxis protein